MLWQVLLSIAIGAAGMPVAVAGSQIDVRPGPVLQPVALAAAVQDPDKREVALRRALRDNLLSPDEKVRNAVFAFLEENSRWIDARPYADIVEDFARIDKLHRGLWLLDEADLTRGSRDERIRILRAAIVQGRTTLARGRPLTRELAMTFGAQTGLVELQPLVEQYRDQVADTWRKSFELDSLSSLFELTAGAMDREDALERGARRLLSMPDGEFAVRMDEDKGFRGAVLRVAEDACAPNPFSGSRNPGCSRIREVSDRQVALQRQEGSEGHRSSTTRESASPGDNPAPTWRETLRVRVQ